MKLEYLLPYREEFSLLLLLLMREKIEVKKVDKIHLLSGKILYTQ